LVDGGTSETERSVVQRDDANHAALAADPVAAELARALAMRQAGASDRDLRRVLRAIMELVDA
jgi:hypothetical protein